MGFRGFRGFRVWGLRFKVLVWGLGFRVLLNFPQWWTPTLLKGLLGDNKHLRS